MQCLDNKPNSKSYYFGQIMILSLTKDYINALVFGYD